MGWVFYTNGHWISNIKAHQHQIIGDKTNITFMIYDPQKTFFSIYEDKFLVRAQFKESFNFLYRILEKIYVFQNNNL